MKKIGILFIALAFLSIACKKNSPENQIIFQDDFSTNKGWTVGNIQSLIYAYNNSKYQITVDTPGIMCWSFAPYGFTPYSGEINYTYSLKVDFTITLDDNSKLGLAGLLFNYIDNQNFSFVFISDNGFYEILQKLNGTPYTIVPATSSKAINLEKGSVNTLELIQNAKTLELNINNQSIGTFQIGKVNSDIRVGLMVSSDVIQNFSKVVA